jgi:hypothetical protein
MAQIFKQAAKKIIESHLVLPVGFVFIVMFLVSIGLFYEDYSTSRIGYENLPTMKANDWIIWLVALVPQLSQIAFGYVYLDDTRKKWALYIVGLSHFIDIFTDCWYKTNGANIFSNIFTPLWFETGGSNLLLWILAGIESEGLYTLGSEVMLVTSVGVLAEILPQFIERIIGVYQAFKKFLPKRNKKGFEDFLLESGLVVQPEGQNEEKSGRGRKPKVENPLMPTEIERIRRNPDEWDNQRPTKPNLPTITSRPTPEVSKAEQKRKEYEEKMRRERMEANGR